MRNEIEKALHKAIYNWVANNFGESEAEDPSWSIEALANDLAHDPVIYDIQQLVEREYRRQDMQTIADEMHVELTEQEQAVCLDEFMESEDYMDRMSATWENIIEHTIELRERNK